MNKTNIKIIGTMISILLLLIGNVSAGDNRPEMAVEDSVDKMSNDTQNSSEDTESIVVIAGEDTNESSAIEDVVLEDVQVTQTEKKSSPGFESMMVMIAFLSAIIIVIRIRRR